MCGIVGLWNWKSNINHPLFEQSVDSLTHRGPDGRGTYYDSHEPLALGHRRLSILDLSSKGHQPMSYANQRFWITYNGEIYNFIEMRNELIGLGYTFFSDSDTEVILASYLKWKENCQYKFNGMWAFAIWDKEEKTLFLSRDRFGVKPLYYFSTPSCFAFASEMKAFLYIPDFEFHLENEALHIAAQYTNLSDVTEKCIFKNVYRLLPGHSITLNSTGILQIKKWWETSDHIQTIPHSFAKRVKLFQELFYSACQLRLRSDVPIATSLSGGLDSSSIIACLNHIDTTVQGGERQAKNKNIAFIADFPDTEQNETSFALDVTRYAKIKPFIYTILSDESFDMYETILYHLEEISTSLHSGPFFIYKNMRRNNITVTLDGHGGDELLAGYHHYPIWALVDCLLPYPKPLEFFRIMRTHKEMFTNKESYHYPLIKNLLPLRQSLLNIETPKDHAKDLLHFSEPKRMMKESFLKRKLYHDFHISFLPTILRNFDRLSMAHGVEIRSPFLDFRLVTFCFALEQSDLIHQGFTKWILRYAFKNRLPDNVRLRKSKLGFTVPIKFWRTKQWRTLFGDVMSSASYIQSPYWNSVAIKKKYELLIKNDQCTSYSTIWPTIQITSYIELMKKKYIELKIKNNDTTP